MSSLHSSTQLQRYQRQRSAGGCSTVQADRTENQAYFSETRARVGSALAAACVDVGLGDQQQLAQFNAT